MDFLPFLETDMSFKILMSLDDPSDLARASCVSHSWHDFVVSQGLCKQLCLRRFPQLSRVDHVKELDESAKDDAEPWCTSSSEREKYEMDHRVYAFLAHCYTTYPARDCILDAISSSSTDNFPEEGIDNTLEMRDRIGRVASYWSSKGNKDPSAPETLIYKLVGDMCVITEIGIRPFEAYFQPGHPIYSARSVRFRVGYPVSPLERATAGANMLEQQSHSGYAEDKFVWTYTSPKFPMAQENQLQKFELQEPVLCIGGFILIELLGRVQRQEMDGLFYLCMAHVQVVGQCLSTSFGIESLEPSGNFALRVLSYAKPTLTESEPTPLYTVALQRRARNLEHMLNALRGNVIDVDFAWDDQEESDDEFV